MPRSRLDEVVSAREGRGRTVKVGDPRDPATTIGPMVSQKQYERVQRYIRIGIEEGTCSPAARAGRTASTAIS